MEKMVVSFCILIVFVVIPFLSPSIVKGDIQADAKVEAAPFVLLRPMEFARAVKTCHDQGRRIAKLSEIYNAISVNQVRVAKNSSFWVALNGPTGKELIALLMSAGLSGSIPREIKRALVSVNKYGGSEYQHIYLCTEQIEEGQRACEEMKTLYDKEFSAYCVK